MTHLGDMARITPPKEVAGDEWRVNAYMVWQSLTRDIELGRLTVVAEQQMRDGAPGRMVATAVRRYVKALWPTLTGDAFEAMVTTVYTYLRQTDNAVCVNPSGKPAPLWLIRREFKPVDTIMVRLGGSAKTAGDSLSYRERKLTPHEAGEDREPEPVTTSTTKKNDDDITTDDLMSLCLQAIAEHDPQPIVATEVAYALGMNTPGQLSSIRSALARLVGKEKIYLRRENSFERDLRWGGTAKARASMWANLYSIHENVPARTEREVVKGYVATRQTMPSRKEVVAAMNSRWHTYEEWAERMGVAPEGYATFQSHLNTLTREGLIQRKRDKGATWYRGHTRSDAGVSRRNGTITDKSGAVKVTEPVGPTVAEDLGPSEKAVMAFADAMGVDLSTLVASDTSAVEELAEQLAAKDNEIRGLKAAIQALTGG